MSDTSANVDWNWEAYSGVFTPLFWLACLLATAVASGFAYLVAASNSGIGFADAVAFSVSSLLQKELDQSFASASPRLSFRIVSLSVLVCGFVVYSTYTATLTSFLSVSLQKPLINSYEDLIRSGKFRTL